MQSIRVQELFSDDGVRYRVPIYQRHYVWNENNWNHLWTDIREKINGRRRQQHFTGVIVIRVTDEEPEMKVIVDGQQRLTTFQIILCAIRDVCTDAGYDKIAGSANRLIRNASIGDLEPIEQFKLLPTIGSDLQAFRPIAAGNAENSSGRIHEAYTYFKKAIEDYVGDIDQIAKLFRIFVREFNVVQLVLDSEHEAAKIFESLNGRGRTLTAFDHLRNNVFLRAGRARDVLYESHWHHFNDDPYWFSDRVLDPFLTNFLKAKLPQKDFDDQPSLFDLYQQDYRKALRESLNLNEDHPELIEREFKELERYSHVYAEIANCSDPGNSLWFYQFLATEFETTSWHPLILFLKSEQTDLGISDKDLKLTFRILESYIIRCMLCYGPKSIHRENHLVSLIREQGVSIQKILTHLKGDNRIKSWPTDEQVESALNEGGRKNAKLIQYILFKIEREVMRDPNYRDSELENFENLDREHVMPQSWETAKGWKVNSENHEKRLDRKNSLHSIGNLTLLHQEVNKNLVADLPFSDEKRISDKKRIYRKYSTLKITDEIREHNDWDVGQIGKRAEDMYERFCKLWPSAEDVLREFGGKNTESSPKSDTTTQAKTDQTEEPHQKVVKSHRGVVNWINARGFGRIMPNNHSSDHPDGIYVHVSDFPIPYQMDSLQPEQEVEFNVISTREGLQQAIDVAHVQR